LSTKKKVATSIIVTLTICLAMTAVLMKVSGVSASELKKKISKPKEELFLEPFEITTNADVNSSSNYVKTKIIVSTMDKDVMKNSEKYNYKIKELLVDYINNQTVARLRDATKKEEVKKELVASLETGLSIDIKNVYFVDFLVE
jgi:flagellar basal body-associated protein FliL